MKKYYLALGILGASILLVQPRTTTKGQSAIHRPSIDLETLAKDVMRDVDNLHEQASEKIHVAIKDVDAATHLIRRGE